VRRPRSDDGSAIVEFVFLAIVMLVPLVYVIATVALLQRNTLAVTQAARDAGRAYATGETPAGAQRRVSAAVRLALADQGLPNDATIRFVRAGADCGGPRITPRLAPGAEFTVCVQRRAHLPAVPKWLSGRGIEVTGAYEVHVDDFRAAP
jgi:Flp pilus assembly protein TadG